MLGGARDSTRATAPGGRLLRVRAYRMMDLCKRGRLAAKRRPVRGIRLSPVQYTYARMLWQYASHRAIEALYTFDAGERGNRIGGGVHGTWPRRVVDGPLFDHAESTRARRVAEVNTRRSRCRAASGDASETAPSSSGQQALGSFASRKRRVSCHVASPDSVGAGRAPDSVSSLTPAVRLGGREVRA